jgi:hypothetical protein
MDFAKACCRDGRNVEWRGLGILTGEMRGRAAGWGGILGPMVH